MKRFFRLSMLLLMIILASALPVPIQFFKKDIMPSFKIEKIVDVTENDDQQLDVFA